MSDELTKADATFDQMHAAIRDGARSDIEAWAHLGRKINDAADTRKAAAKTTWTAEERYRLIRLAHLGHMYVTGKLLGREL